MVKNLPANAKDVSIYQTFTFYINMKPSIFLLRLSSNILIKNGYLKNKFIQKYRYSKQNLVVSSRRNSELLGESSI